MTQWLDEPFELFRTTLFVSLAAYYGLTSAVAGLRLASLLRGQDPRKKLLRLYLSYQLVSVRLQPLRKELLQIGLWAAILCLIWWWHPSP